MASKGSGSISGYGFIEVDVALLEEVYQCGMGFEASVARALPNVVLSSLPVVCISRCSQHLEVCLHAAMLPTMMK